MTVTVGRFEWTPPWNTTHYGFGFHPFPRRGFDEWHNESRYVVWPLVGVIAAFVTIVDTSGREHVYGRTGDEWHGRIVDGCEVCAELVSVATG